MVFRRKTSFGDLFTSSVTKPTVEKTACACLYTFGLLRKTRAIVYVDSKNFSLKIGVFLIWKHLDV